MALFGTPSWSHQPAHSIKHCWYIFIVDVWVAPATAWQTEEGTPCQCNTYLWAAKRLNADMADPSAPGLPKHPWQDLLWWDSTKECLPTCCELGSQGTSIQHGATRIKSLSWPLTSSARNLDRSRGTNAGGGNITDLKCPRMVEGIWPRGPQRKWCFNGVIMLALSSLGGCNASRSTYGRPQRQRAAWATWGRTCLSVRLNIWQASLERKGDTVPS